jgi:hypothetical protein
MPVRWLRAGRLAVRGTRSATPWRLAGVAARRRTAAVAPRHKSYCCCIPRVLSRFRVIVAIEVRVFGAWPRSERALQLEWARKWLGVAAGCECCACHANDAVIVSLAAQSVVWSSHLSPQGSEAKRSLTSRALQTIEKSWCPSWITTVNPSTHTCTTNAPTPRARSKRNPGAPSHPAQVGCVARACVQRGRGCILLPSAAPCWPPTCCCRSQAPF